MAKKATRKKAVKAKRAAAKPARKATKPAKVRKLSKARKVTKARKPAKARKVTKARRAAAGKAVEGVGKAPVQGPDQRAAEAVEALQPAGAPVVSTEHTTQSP